MNAYHKGEVYFQELKVMWISQDIRPIIHKGCFTATVFIKLTV